MKKILATALAAVMALSLAACTTRAPSGSTGTTSTPSQGSKPGEVTEVRLTLWGDFTEADVEMQLVNEFNKNNSDIQIKFEPLPGDSYGQKLMANFAAGTACDIFLIGEGDYMMYYDQGVTANLNDLYKASSNFNLEAYNKGLIEMGTFDGNLHYLPKDFNPIALYYNKDMFDAAKLEYPSDDWTWEDLEAAAKVMTDEANGQYGFYADTWDYATMLYLKSLGAEIGSEDATKAEGFVNSQATIDAVTRYTNYIVKDKISPAKSAAEDFGGATSMFQSGKIGMFISGGWNINTLDEAGTNYGTALVPMAEGGNRAEIICAASYAIYEKSQNKEAAWRVLEWMTGPEAHAARSAENIGVLPAFDDQLDKKVAEFPQVAGLAKMMDYAFKTVRMRGITGQYFSEPYNMAIEEIVLTGADVKTALDKAAKTIDSAIAEHGN